MQKNLDQSECKTLGDTPRSPLIPNVTIAAHFTKLKFQEDSLMAETCVSQFYALIITEIST